MALVNGATYRLQSRADTKRSLNVYGTSPASLANVCLYTNDNNDICQQWVYKKSGSREYFVCKGNQNLALDLFTGSSSAANVKNYNAHVYAPSETSYITVEEISGGYIRIKLDYNDRYLTANQGSNGTSGGKDVNAAGNVYFYNGGLTDLSQDWKPIPLDGTTPDPEPGENNPYADLNWRYVFDDKSNCSGRYGYDTTASIAPAYHKHMGIDVICPAGVEIKSPARGTVYAVGGTQFQRPDDPDANISGTTPHKSMGYFVVLKMDDKDPITGRTMYVRFLHMRDVPSLEYGETVSAGTLLGYVGNSGYSDTAHLHLDVNTMTANQYWGDNMTANNTINPVNFFPGIKFPSHYFAEGVYGK